MLSGIASSSVVRVAARNFSQIQKIPSKMELLSKIAVIEREKGDIEREKADIEREKSDLKVERAELSTRLTAAHAELGNLSIRYIIGNIIA